MQRDAHLGELPGPTVQHRVAEQRVRSPPVRVPRRSPDGGLGKPGPASPVSGHAPEREVAGSFAIGAHGGGVDAGPHDHDGGVGGIRAGPQEGEHVVLHDEPASPWPRGEVTGEVRDLVGISTAVR